MMKHPEIYSQAQLMELIQEIGFLPLLDSGIRGYSAEEMVSDDCRYVMLPDGGWDWPLWKWKGPIVTEGNVVYGKFFDKKAGFISRQWWQDFYNLSPVASIPNHKKALSKKPSCLPCKSMAV
jgi:hypothetical protein